MTALYRLARRLRREQADVWAQRIDELDRQLRAESDPVKRDRLRWQLIEARDRQTRERDLADRGR